MGIHFLQLLLAVHTHQGSREGMRREYRKQKGEGSHLVRVQYDCGASVSSSVEAWAAGECELLLPDLHESIMRLVKHF